MHSGFLQKYEKSQLKFSLHSVIAWHLNLDCISTPCIFQPLLKMFCAKLEMYEISVVLIFYALFLFIPIFCDFFIR